MNDYNSNKERDFKRIALVVVKVLGLLACLYFFVVSLDLMSSAFRLVGGKTASQALSSNVILENKIAGLMIGVLVTVVVQSSSTSTSIVISMVSSSILSVEQAIPIIMGANIGTSITGTLVALTQAVNKENFRRAFSCSTLNDTFNILTVLVLLPLEYASGYLNFFSGLIVNAIFSRGGNTQIAEVEILNAITKPLSNLIIQLDKEVLNNIAINNASPTDTLIKHFCPAIVDPIATFPLVDPTVRCKFLLESLEDWPEWAVGLLLLVVSLLLLIGCLLIMVKILTSLLKGSAKKIVEKTVNSDYPGYLRYLNGIVAILIGAGLTFVIQSSSVLISCLVPLVGLGHVELERVLPLTLGANIGTTITGILAAFSSQPSTLKNALQLALCHTIFNITGIIIWYPLPFMRKVPISISKMLGSICGEYRWFAIAYLIIVFFFIPFLTFLLSLAGLIVFLCFLVPILLFCAALIVINVMQEKAPKWLPEKLRNWDWLPLWLHSLEPYDTFIKKYILVCKCANKLSSVDQVDSSDEPELPFTDSQDRLLEKKSLNSQV